MKPIGAANAFNELSARASVALLRLVHGLPAVLQWRLGRAFGQFAFWLVGSRRKVVLRNLAACFPKLSERERALLAQRHFRALGAALLDFGNLWWSDESRLRARHALVGRQHLDALQAAGRPVIVLGLHCVGIEAAGVRLAMDYKMTAFYTRQSNPAMDERLRRARKRFIPPNLLKKDDGGRALVRSIKSGAPVYYLPDMDYGPRDSIFVPFFGVPAATITGLSRLARLAGAAIVPCVTRQLPNGEGYETRLDEPWPNFPSGDDVADARTLNAWLESVILEMPEQYYWVHKRFKTRPHGEPNFYG
jgi:KDO2-lipid IV(A) lauroyltransferase